MNLKNLLMRTLGIFVIIFSLSLLVVGFDFSLMLIYLMTSLVLNVSLDILLRIISSNQ